jgi:hypothetical protein
MDTLPLLHSPNFFSICSSFGDQVRCSKHDLTISSKRFHISNMHIWIWKTLHKNQNAKLYKVMLLPSLFTIKLEIRSYIHTIFFITCPCLGVTKTTFMLKENSLMTTYLSFKALSKTIQYLSSQQKFHSHSHNCVFISK